MSLICLYLMTEKGLTVLNTVLRLQLKTLISAVVIGRDKNVVNDYSKEIEYKCIEYGLNWYYRGQEPDIPSTYQLAVSWRWLLPVKNQLIIFHDSPLPRYRGFAPLVNQLIQGEREIGVSALFAEKQYDRGRLIAVERADVEYPITIQSAIHKSLVLYERLAENILSQIQRGEEISSYEQDESKATYSLWRDELDYYIDWSKDADWIERFVDATGFPYQQSKAKLNGEVIVVSKVKAQPDIAIHNRDVGKVIFVEEGLPAVVCGRGLIKICSAVWEHNRESILPLRNFKSRFH